MARRLQFVFLFHMTTTSTALGQMQAVQQVQPFVFMAPNCNMSSIHNVRKRNRLAKTTNEGEATISSWQETTGSVVYYRVAVGGVEATTRQRRWKRYSCATPGPLSLLDYHCNPTGLHYLLN